MAETRTLVKDFWIDPPFEQLPLNTQEFSFGYTEQGGEKRRYKVQIDPGIKNSVEAFHILLWKINDAKKKSYLPWRDPELSRLKPMLKITNLDGPAVTPSIPPILKSASNNLDKIASRVESKGLYKLAYAIDIISNTLDSWHSNKATLFFDEIANIGVEPKDAIAVLDAAEKQGLK